MFYVSSHYISISSQRQKLLDSWRNFLWITRERMNNFSPKTSPMTTSIHLFRLPTKAPAEMFTNVNNEEEIRCSGMGRNVESFTLTNHLFKELLLGNCAVIVYVSHWLLACHIWRPSLKRDGFVFFYTIGKLACERRRISGEKYNLRTIFCDVKIIHQSQFSS